MSDLEVGNEYPAKKSFSADNASRGFPDVLIVQGDSCFLKNIIEIDGVTTYFFQRGFDGKRFALTETNALDFFK